MSDATRLPTGLPSHMPSGMPPWIADPTVSGSTTRGQYSVSCLWCGDALTTCHDELADHFLAFHRSNHAAQDGDE